MFVHVHVGMDNIYDVYRYHDLRIYAVWDFGYFYIVMWLKSSNFLVLKSAL